MNSLTREISRIKRQISNAADDLRNLEVLLAETGAETSKGGESAIIFEEELAELFGRHLATIQRWRKAGKLDPYYKKGRKFYWLRSDLEEVMKAGNEAEASESEISPAGRGNARRGKSSNPKVN